MDDQFKRLARRQLSRTMSGYRRAAQNAETPREGWIAAVREALGMPVRDLAQRMGIGHASLVRLEQREKDGAATLSALRKAASALGCDLVYALVPRTEGLGRISDEQLLDSLIMTHARAAAADDMRRVNKTMALEDQAISAPSQAAQLEERARVLAAEPRLLWQRVGRRSRKSPKGAK